MSAAAITLTAPWRYVSQRLDRLTADHASVVFLVLLSALVLLTVGDYGITWDEDVHSYYGNLVLNYYTSGFHDTEALTWWNLYEYGAAFDALAALLHQVSPFDLYETRHLLNAVVGVIGVIGTWKLARTVAGPRAAFWAALFLALVPTYYGHMFNNPKDVPFAAGMVWATYYVARMLPLLPAPSLSLVLRFGLAAGLTAGVRVGGLMLMGYLGLAIAAVALWRATEAGSVNRFVVDCARGLARAWLPGLLVAYPVMLMAWPWAQQAPLANPFTALCEFSHHSYPWKTLYNGDYYWADQTPWSYLPVHILLKTPELFVLLTAAAFAWACWRVAHRQWWRDPTRVLGHCLVGFALMFPVVYAVLIRAILFDGMRHFLFVIPPLCVLAAIMFEHGLAWLRTWPWRHGAFAALALYFGYHASVMMRLHPDQYVYYNAFIGGVDGAEGLFKLDYWGNSYAEAVHGLENILRESYGEEFESRTFKIRVCGPKMPAKFFFPSNFVETFDDPDADFVISMSNYVPSGIPTAERECARALAGREIYRVERLDTLLSVVVDRRELKIGQSLALRASHRLANPRP